MEIFELKKNLEMLVQKYIYDKKHKDELLEMINREGVPGVKGILAELNRYSDRIEEKDGELIKDIVYYYV